MKVLYGVQGTGNGHLARARSLVPALRDAGVDLDILLSGRNPRDYFNMEVFGSYRCKRGLTLAVERGRLSYLRTFTQNRLSEFLRDVIRLELETYDLVITDFEPISAWAAALRGVPSLGISHQCAFLHDVPKVGGYSASRQLMRFFAPAKENVGLHWHHFNQPILPPLIEPHTARPCQENKILVYMGFEALPDIVEFLSPFPGFEFHVFAKVEVPTVVGHINIHPVSHGAFHRQLEDCAGVISNAGFELASECLALGKKLLVRPLHGQFEQLSNALGLQALGRASVMNGLDQEMLREWLQLGPHQAIDYPDVATALAQWLAEPQRREVSQLAEQLWGQFFHPYTVKGHASGEIQAGLVV